MKLPSIKLPKFKLPKISLPKIKLPSFGKKDDDDDFDEFDDDFDPDDYEAIEGDDDGDGDAGDASDDAAADAGDGASDAPAAVADDPPAASGEATADEGAAEDTDDDAAGMPTPSRDGDDDDDDDYDDDDDDEEGGGFKNPFAAMDRKKLILVAVAALGTMLVIGGGAWWLIGGDDDEAVSIAPVSEDGALTPPGGDGAEADAGYDPNSLNALGQKDAAAPDEGIVVAATSKAAYSGISPPQGVSGLSPAPDAALTEPSAQGLLPKVAVDGRQAWQVYARPLDAKTPTDVPRIAVIVKGLGLSEAATEAAITLLSPVVTLAFDPYAKGLQHMGARAREYGHETLVSVPLESGLFPAVDPGTKSLMTALKKEENTVTLEGMLGGMSGYVGIFTTHGTKFNQSEHHVTNLMETLKTRGLMVVEGGPLKKSEMPKAAAKAEVPRAKADLSELADLSPAGIKAYLAKAESLARERSAVVVVVEPYPSVVRALPGWLASLAAKKIVVVPVTAVANKQFLE